MTSALFQPYKLADLALDNRIAISPMCQYSANDGCASDWHLTHLGMLAGSGAALVVVEATHVERLGRITHGCMGLYSDANEEALARALAHARTCGAAKFGIQLAHAGRKGSARRPWEGGVGLTANEDPWETISPSALPFGPSKWHTPRAATEEDMARVRDAFVAAAKRAVRIGFDAIELHAAHGYLIHSFISPVSNKRTDRYGGSLENRLRFALEVADAVRAVVPKGLPLGARITASDWLDGGITPDEAVVFARKLKAAGLDYLDVTSGGLTADARNPTAPGYNAAFAARVRKEAGIATRAVGLIVTPQQAEAVIADGQADMVALGRAALDHPHWAWQAAYALGAEANIPKQYLRAGKAMWPGVEMR